jgi:uncharacterized protein YbjT (DUF2867 family)
MKIVVIGGSGLIGTKLVKILRDDGHEVVAASRSTGVNTLTGEGLADALAGAAVVVDVSNAPSWEDHAVLEFFETSGRHIQAAEKAAGVGHHVALSVVGTDRLQASGYFRAKLAQENLIKASGIPYTIVRATQFFEFVGGIAESGADGNAIRLSQALMQPIAADDVAAILADIATSVALAHDEDGGTASATAVVPCDATREASLLNTTIDIAGPEPIGMDDLARQFLIANRDPRQVTTDPTAGYFGTRVDDKSLVPISPSARLGPTRFAEWLTRAVPPA